MSKAMGSVINYYARLAPRPDARTKSPDVKVCLLTGVGLIRGKIDYHLADALRKKNLAAPDDSSGRLFEDLDVIPLTEVGVYRHDDSIIEARYPSMVIFAEHVIAVLDPQPDKAKTRPNNVTDALGDL